MKKDYNKRYDKIAKSKWFTIKYLKPKTMKWKYNEALFMETWVADHFKIELVEGYEERDSYLLIYYHRQVQYFKTLAKAKKVAQLIYEG